MKSLLITALLISSSAFACRGDAKLSPTKIVKIIKTEKSCRAFLETYSNIAWNEECYLDDSDLSKDGIEISHKSGGCRADVGENLSGHIFQNRDRSIGIE
jgi:hypothetical protein